MTVQKRFAAAVTASLLALALPLLAQKPPNAPANATAQCQDGTYSTAKTERGACSKHGGVKTWWGTTAAPSKSKSAKKEPPPTKSAQKGASAGATGECADGTFTRAKT